VGNTCVEATPEEGRVTILLVEDEPLIRCDMAQTLAELGMVVVEAASADEAWDFLTSGEKVDLVFSDICMPGSMNGAELAGKIKQTYSGIAVILTSGYAGIAATPAPVLSKPYRIAETAAVLVKQARAARLSG
jgi:CheY-like chemotaxis protein